MVDVQQSWQALGLPSVPWTYGLADLAGSVARATLHKDYGARNAFVEIDKAVVALGGHDLDAVVPQMLAELRPRALDYAASDAWATKAVYEHLQAMRRPEPSTRDAVEAKGPQGRAPEGTEASTGAFEAAGGAFGVRSERLGGAPDGAPAPLADCPDIFRRYCCRVLGRSFDVARAMYMSQESALCCSPSLRETLVAVHCPSPEGPQLVTLAEVEEYWKGVAPHDLCACPGDDAVLREAEIAWFLSVVIVRLTEAGYLDAEHRPTATALHARTRDACPELVSRARALSENWKVLLHETLQRLETPSTAYQLVTYDSEFVGVEAVGAVAVKQFRAVATLCTGEEYEERCFGDAEAAEQASAVAAFEALVYSTRFQGTPQHKEFSDNNWRDSNWKGLLLEWLAKRRSPVAQFDTWLVDDRYGWAEFQATVTVMGVEYQGVVGRTKKEAERFAAMKACRALGIE